MTGVQTCALPIYPHEIIWTELLSGTLGPEWRVINAGRNGRRIPVTDAEYGYVMSLVKDAGENDLLAVMLGTNDILLSASPDADRTVSHMGTFLQHVLALPGHPRLLLIAPPPIAAGQVAGPLYAKFHEESLRMSAGFRRLADSHGIAFADAADWGIDLAYDCVHFTEAGHSRFAAALAALISQM